MAMLHPTIRWETPPAGYGDEIVYRFRGSFPFRTYADHIIDCQMSARCDCGEELLRIEVVDNASIWCEVSVCKTCPECGRCIVVAGEDDNEWYWEDDDEKFTPPVGWELVRGADEDRALVWTAMNPEGEMDMDKMERKTVHPDVSWKIRSDQWGSNKEIPYHFDGTFPFETHLDTEVDYTDFSVECPVCGNELLKTVSERSSNSCWGKVDVKKYCDECGSKIEVPRNDMYLIVMDGEFEMPDGWAMVRCDGHMRMYWTGIDEKSVREQQ